MHGSTYTVWLSEQGGECLSPAPNATESGRMRSLKLIGRRKSSSHVTRTRQVALGHRCRPLPPLDLVGDAHPQAPRRKMLAEDVAGTDVTMISSLIVFIIIGCCPHVMLITSHCRACNYGYTCHVQFKHFTHTTIRCHSHYYFNNIIDCVVWEKRIVMSIPPSTQVDHLLLLWCVFWSLYYIVIEWISYSAVLGPANGGEALLMHDIVLLFNHYALGHDLL